ncbi:hypothetical protein QTO34_000473 [Cnephaeus nilssonii]|uniref:Uncharacterized protein n=1 Tax=Cnephaeus nilssonii TaxID=3371016 RepID=A0AA40IBH5_CNENI|nr:hypothetical protein QTO34_000473 [Eptesicus nilssonii]
MSILHSTLIEIHMGDPILEHLLFPMRICVALAMLSLRACYSTQTQILEYLDFNLTDLQWQRSSSPARLPKTDLVTEFSKEGARIANRKHSLLWEMAETSSKVIGLYQNINNVMAHIGEKGTKAVAITEVTFLDLYEITLFNFTTQFDRTFLLLVLEKNIRSILFLGKVVNSMESKAGLMSPYTEAFRQALDRIISDLRRILPKGNICPDTHIIRGFGI